MSCCTKLADFCGLITCPFCLASSNILIEYANGMISGSLDGLAVQDSELTAHNTRRGFHSLLRQSLATLALLEVQECCVLSASVSGYYRGEICSGELGRRPGSAKCGSVLNAPCSGLLHRMPKCRNMPDKGKPRQWRDLCPKLLYHRGYDLGVGIQRL